MKLQYLGDVRDAFKWDLLHWICTEAEPCFQKLLFVPLLTPDDPAVRDGRISHFRFGCRPSIRSLIQALAEYPRSFEHLRMLGRMEGSRHFEVILYQPELHIGRGHARENYWHEIGSYLTPDTLVFLDPDNGFETKTRKGTKWVRHREIRKLLSHPAGVGGVAVYQHRPQRRPWRQIFAELSVQLDYAAYAAAAYEANLAFLALAQADDRGRLQCAIQGYVARHPVVRFAQLRATMPRPPMPSTAPPSSK